MEAFMRWVRAIVSLVLSAAVFWGLDNRHGTFPALGKLLNPFAGFWQNGSRPDAVPDELVVPGLRDEVRVVWDARRVPHIFAQNDHDLYLAQGYVAASLRLWQMEFQALYTAGRISEVVGPVGLRQDIFTRRFGLPWAAENAVHAFRDDPKTREVVDAFTAGVNAYIRTLDRKGLLVEYKILDYRPEVWTDYKCALLLKAMAYSLSSYNQDAAMTQMMKMVKSQGGFPGWEDFGDRLFPFMPPLVDPVIPPGTPLDFVPLPVPTRSGAEKGGGNTDGENGHLADSRLEATPSDPSGFESPGYRTGPGIGSNNWAVSGKRTRNGFPILANDMHLELSLPAIWYEIQLSAPGVNVRGVAFPAAPLVVAGYNESVAWGFTNGTDDVLDWYDITFKDDSRAEYLYAGEWRKTTVREEKIKVRGGSTVADKVVYTHYGPVVRLSDEPPFINMNVPPNAALRWLAHDASSEFSTLYALNRARNYADYVEALKTWDCPAQNIVFADREGTIAIWHDGKFPLRWKGQGRYVLDGSDPADEWRGWVPRGHVPHVKDPDRGFVSSANQMPADAGYPYYLGWDYASYERGARINEILRSAHDITPADMVRMQTDVLDIRARAVLPSLLDLIKEKPATEAGKKSLAELRAWNFEARAALIAPTIFREFWNELNRLTWEDEKPPGVERISRPASQVMVDQILNDPHGKFFDDADTDGTVETLSDVVRQAFQAAVANLEKRLGPFGETWRWGEVKGTQLRHVARIPGLGRDKLVADGVGHVIDAIDAVWAPSWRMVVELGPEVKAWGNYPGGQSGNPGSKFYDDFVNDWAAGKPYELVFLKSADEPNPAVVGRTLMRGGK
jgi:penicillin amidase